MNPNVGSNPKRLWYVAGQTNDKSGQVLRSRFRHFAWENGSDSLTVEGLHKKELFSK